jgi:hypothetical protein
MLHILQYDHLATTAYCSCLGAVHARGAAEGWSDARQRAREAEGDGGRGADVHVRQEAEGARAIQIEARSEGRSFLGYDLEICSFLYDFSSFNLHLNCCVWHMRIQYGYAKFFLKKR